MTQGRMASVLDATHTIIARAVEMTRPGHAVIATDPLGTILYWSDGAETLYGWAREAVLGRNVVDVTPSPDAQAEASSIMRHLRSGENWTGTFRLRRRDGTPFTAMVTDVPVFDRGGKLVGIVGVAEPITK